MLSRVCILLYNIIHYLQIGRTPLHEAAKQGYLHICQALLETPNITPNPTDEVSKLQNTK